VVRIKTVRGDATRPVGDGSKVICHVCNDSGAWGAGFVLALSERWPEPEREYRRWHLGKSETAFELGRTQLVQVEEDVWVANMLAQHGMRARDGTPPIRYDALEQCLTEAASLAAERNASLHMPRIGSGLAGGDWGKIRGIVDRAAREAGVRAVVYDFPGRVSADA